MAVKEIQLNDWSAILQIQADVYVDVAPEPEAVMKSKWLVSPTLCYVYKNTENTVLGYLLAHRWTSPTPPKLYQQTQPNQGDILFVHDLALSPMAKGQGIGRLLVEQLLVSAKQQGLTRALLVSIQNTERFWQQFGFEVAPVGVSSTYGEGAVIMSRTL
jgi:ribosomal protein S18 acetylase RimI-like enzyme